MSDIEVNYYRAETVDHEKTTATLLTTNTAKLIVLREIEKRAR
jgi:hypothetical protein